MFRTSDLSAFEHGMKEGASIIAKINMSTSENNLNRVRFYLVIPIIRLELSKYIITKHRSNKI